MANLDINDIRKRAYQLWRLAGEPKGMDAHFWEEAERQLKEEQAPQRKPDKE